MCGKEKMGGTEIIHSIGRIHRTKIQTANLKFVKRISLEISRAIWRIRKEDVEKEFRAGKIQ